MNDAHTARAATAVIRHDGLVGSAANGVINAAISAMLLRGKGPHPLTIDSIAAGQHTVLGSAVTMALALGLVVGTVTFMTFRRKARGLGLADASLLQRPFFRFGLGRVLSAAVTMTAMVVLVAVLWQRFVGSVTVATPVAAALSGMVAALTAWHVGTRASRALLNPF